MNQLQCNQCSRPALYGFQHGVNLCLDCYAKVHAIQQSDSDRAERLINFASDHMDEIVGFGPSGARFPERPRPVMISGASVNNINVSNSVVGTINTGSIDQLRQSITANYKSGHGSIADALKALSAAAVDSTELTIEQKNELVELFNAISTEALAPPDQRKGAVAKALLDRAGQVMCVAASLGTAVAAWMPVLAAAFGG